MKFRNPLSLLGQKVTDMGSQMFSDGLKKLQEVQIHFGQKKDSEKDKLALTLDEINKGVKDLRRKVAKQTTEIVKLKQRYDDGERPAGFWHKPENPLFTPFVVVSSIAIMLVMDKVRRGGPPGSSSDSPSSSDSTSGPSGPSSSPPSGPGPSSSLLSGPGPSSSPPPGLGRDEFEEPHGNRPDCVLEEHSDGSQLIDSLFEIISQIEFADD